MSTKARCALFVLCVGLLFSFERRPPDGKMRVAYVYGDIDLPRIYPETWNLGVAQRCQLASRTAPTPNDARDLLLCGEQAKLAWQLTWLRADVKSAIYDASMGEMVYFRNSGHGGGRNSSKWWSCTRTSSGLDCR